MTGATGYRHLTSCRICRATTFMPVVDLGETPLANAFVLPDQSDRVEPRFPLAAVRCVDCGLVQLSVVVAPEVLFRHYLYTSSASAPLRDHFDAYAAEVTDRFVPAGASVVEMGSNDGLLLGLFARRGARILGIEPASNLSERANAAGLTTRNDFFGSAVARDVASTSGRAAVIVANNVLAHIDDLTDVLAGIDALLADSGVFVAEVPYLPDLLDHVEYDTMYHEHLSYFALRPLARLFAGAGMELFDVRRLPVHGGSVRIFAARRGRHAITSALDAAIAQEESLNLSETATYEKFSSAVRYSRDSLRDLVCRSRADGARVAALGATAKGNTLLNYCGLGLADIDYVADSTPLKQGLLTPGTHIPVVAESRIRTDRPDLTLLLAWNYADAILARFGDYIGAGGRFIHPVPSARLIPS